MKNDIENIQELWTALKTNGNRYKPVWDDIARFVGISVQTNYMWYNQQSTASNPVDQFIDDPTSAISVNQAGDYLIGIMWGTGENVFDIIPSRYVLEITDKSAVEEWYKFATEQTLYHMNHTEGGFHTAIRSYAYDQVAFGNSGIGAFPNKDFTNRVADNAITYRNYGVDNTRIDEGKNGTPDVVGTVYRWRTNRIINEFAANDGVLNEKLYAQLPDAIQKAHKANDLNREFNIVCLILPRTDFDPALKGKRGARYRGVWFLEEEPNNIFYEESFAEKPIAWARQIKVRGEVYGRSSGTLLISSIKAVNYMVGTVIEILEKMANPSLGIFNSAIFGDSVLDTSPNGLTIFNQTMMNGAQAPLFPIHDVGDPEGIIKFLIPYLNEKITTAFKVDALLDMNNEQEMTATESLQRYAIRGKSLSGMLQQQKIECLEPTSKRSISILFNIGELGVNPNEPEGKDKAASLTEAGKTERVIPDAVLQTIKKGRPWYELKFNNELERLMRTQTVQNLLQILQTIIAIAQAYPDIIHAVDWYKLLKEINENLDYNNQILMDEKKFKATIAGIAQQRQAAMMMQAGQAAGGIAKDTATAQKTKAEAGQIGTPNGLGSAAAPGV